MVMHKEKKKKKKTQTGDIREAGIRQRRSKVPGSPGGRQWREGTHRPFHKEELPGPGNMHVACSVCLYSRNDFKP